MEVLIINELITMNPKRLQGISIYIYLNKANIYNALRHCTACVSHWPLMAQQCWWVTRVLCNTTWEGCPVPMKYQLTPQLRCKNNDGVRGPPDKVNNLNDHFQLVATHFQLFAIALINFSVTMSHLPITRPPIPSPMSCNISLSLITLTRPSRLSQTL
jgi:hypothetical protein